MFSTFRQDLVRIRPSPPTLSSFVLAYTEISLLPLSLFRFAGWIRSLPFQPLRSALLAALFPFRKIAEILTGIRISPDSEIGPGLVIHNFGDIVIQGRLGKNCTIVQGAQLLSRDPGCPVLGDNVYLGSGSKLVGNVRIGNNARIGANAVVMNDVPDSATVLPPESPIVLATRPLPPSSNSAVSAPRRGSALRLLPAVLFVLAAWAFYLASPRAGDFYWNDAPRHAMDGAFYVDLFRTLPFSHLKEWGTQYWLQYPAATVLFYPPGFALLEAIVFAVLGVSHAHAQLTVALLAFALMWGMYRLGRLWLNRPLACSLALLFLGLPEISLWGRQVMLEVPTLAFLAWSAFLFLRYLENDRPRDFHLAVVLLCGALYTKQTAAFVAVAYALALGHARGWRALAHPRHLKAALLGCLLLAPLAAFTMAASVNVSSVTGSGWAGWTKYARTDPRCWTYYAEVLPAQLGWLVLALALVYAAAACWKPSWRVPRHAHVLLSAWFLCGYFCFSLVAHKEPRFSDFTLLPLAVFALYGTVQCLPARFSILAAALGPAMFCYSLANVRVPVIRGYAEAARFTEQHAAPDSVILFSGERSGNYVFGLRACESRHDLAVLRLDNLLFPHAVFRQGVEEKVLEEDQMESLLHRLGVRWIVIEPSWFADLKIVRRFQNVIRRPSFKKIAVLPVSGKLPPGENRVEIYENLAPPPSQKEKVRLNLKLVGITVEGVPGAAVKH